MSIALITSPAFTAYRLPVFHPDQPRRLEAVQDRLIASGLDPLLRPFDAPRVAADLLARVHEADYLAGLEAKTPGEGWISLDGDTWLAPGILEAAYRASGAAALGVDLTLAGTVHGAFALGRPPGHHAHADHAAGFCLLNHIAVAAARAREHGLRRIAIVDFDAHCGDGTESLVAGSPDIRMYSLYQEGGFGSPAAPPAENIRRLPLPPRAEGETFRQGVEGYFLGDLAEFRPEVMLISAGFDGHREDDLSDLRLVEGDYAWLVRRLSEVSGCPKVFSLEGGYEPAALARSVHAALHTLLEHG
jgi:acetoin utilization deacetylase AcuC-like enzyme